MGCSKEEEKEEEKKRKTISHFIFSKQLCANGSIRSCRDLDHQKNRRRLHFHRSLLSSG